MTGWKRLLKVSTKYSAHVLRVFLFFLPSACAKWHPSSPVEESYCESGQAAKPEVEDVASKSTLPDPVLAKDEQSSHT